MVAVIMPAAAHICTSYIKLRLNRELICQIVILKKKLPSVTGLSHSIGCSYLKL